MGNLAVIGMDWGDEGKGKAINLLMPRFDIVARYNGGANAGHTVSYCDRDYSLHSLPSGVFVEGRKLLIGNGFLLALSTYGNNDGLLQEIDAIGQVVDMRDRLYISDGAHIILPHHIEADKHGSGVGSTKRGIGPAAEAKANRTGVRVGDLMALDAHGDYKDLEKRILRGCDATNVLAGLYRQRDFFDGLIQRYGVKVVNASQFLTDAFSHGQSVLFEGAQGTMLDIDHGTYPTVTSTSSTAGGICTGLGISPKQVHKIIGIAKATESRVGDGPFPTEDEYFNPFRGKWGEFGATTQRPRRLGWRDAVQLRYAADLNGVDHIVLTCLDRLGDIPDRLRICVGYKIDGREVNEWPTCYSDQTKAKPVYRDLDNWHCDDISGARHFDDLPLAAQVYVRELEKETGYNIGLISVGKEPDQCILKDKTLLNGQSTDDAGGMGVCD